MNDGAPGIHSFNRDFLKAQCAELAQNGVFIGTSSWKYPGWRGQLYEEDRYVFRGKFAKTRFNKSCLTEYAEVFKTVCVDAAYYKFPDRIYLQGMVSQVPSDFLFTFKVTDFITLKQFPQVERFAGRAGMPNRDFLNADLFISEFLGPCSEFKSNIGLLMFEFSHFNSKDFGRGRDFVEALDGFLSKLPKGWHYGVEIRNKNFLHPDYFAMLTRHGVAHVFNSWSGMLPVSEQLAMPGSFSHPGHSGARFLLKPGRKYQKAVDIFHPYTEIKDPYEDARLAATKLISAFLGSGGVKKLFLYVNNRLEGNALLTIMAMLERLKTLGTPAV